MRTNFNTYNESLRTQKGSLIKRYEEVGKKMGNDLYFHKNYVDEYIEPDFYNKLKSYLPEGVEFNIIKYNDRENYISFINSPDFDTADEPIVSDAYKVTEDGRITYTREKRIPQIYHHKWLFVKDDYTGFNVENSIRRSEKWLKHTDKFNMAKIGSMKYWEEEVLPLLEGLKDKIKGKSEDSIKNIIESLSNIELESLLINTLQNRFDSDSEPSLLFIEKNLNKNRLENIWSVMIYEYLEIYPEDIDEDIDKEWMINNQRFADLLDSMVSLLSFKEIKFLLFKIMFNKSINESLKDKIKGISEEKFQYELKKLTDNIIKIAMGEKYFNNYETAYKYFTKPRGKYKNGIEFFVNQGWSDAEEMYSEIFFMDLYNEREGIKIDESLKDKIKGKSEKEINNLINTLDPNELLDKGAKYGNVDLIKTALDKGADINSTVGGDGAIVTAAKNGQAPIIKMLSDAGSNQYNKDRAIKLTMKYGMPRTTKVLYYCGAKFDIETLRECIINSAKENWIEHTEFLLKFLTDTDSNYFFLKKTLGMVLRHDTSIDEWGEKVYNNVEMINVFLHEKQSRPRRDGDRYNKYNESLKDKIVGKSEEEISDIIEDKMDGKSDEEKLKYGLENHIQYLVEDSLKNGIDYLDGSYINILFDCVENDDFEIIKILFKYVDDRTKEHITNLACKLNKLNIVKFAIKNGIDVNGANNLFLLESIENENIEIVKYLIEQGVDIHRESILNDRGERFLFLAVRRGYYDIVKLLLENGADPLYSNSLAIKMASQTKKKKNIYNILKKYAMKKRIKKIKKFVGFNTNESLKDKIVGKSEEEVSDIIEDKVQHYIEKNNTNRLLMYSAAFGSLRGLKIGLDDTDYKISKDMGKHLVSRTMANGHLELLRYLISKGYTSFFSDIGPRMAIEKGHNHIIEYLLNNGYEPKNIDELLNIANQKTLDDLQDGNGINDIVDILKDYINKKHEVGIMSKTGEMFYEENDMNESLKDKLKGKSREELIDNIKDLSPTKQLSYSDKYNILSKKEIYNIIKKFPTQEQFYNACKYGILSIVKQLIEEGNIDITSHNNLPIRFASTEGHLEVVKELLKDEEVDPSDHFNQAIKGAVIFGHLEVVKELLKDNRFIINNKDMFETIFSAKKRGHVEIVDTLEQYKDMNESNTIWEKPEQELPSAKTSVRQIPKPVKILINNNELEPNTINLDIGGGRFENMTEFLSKFNVTNYVYDPFNRSESHNEMVLEKTKDGQSDSVTIFNVLNVIKEKENQIRVLEQAKNAVKDGGKIYIYSNYYVKGQEAREVKGRNSFQQNYRLNDVLSIVQNIFPNAYLSRELKCVIAIK